MKVVHCHLVIFNCRSSDGSCSHPPKQCQYWGYYIVQGHSLSYCNIPPWQWFVWQSHHNVYVGGHLGWSIVQVTTHRGVLYLSPFFISLCHLQLDDPFQIHTSDTVQKITHIPYVAIESSHSQPLSHQPFPIPQSLTQPCLSIPPAPLILSVLCPAMPAHL